jgi:hypothetical protein
MRIDMGDTLQYRRVNRLEYALGSGELKLNMDGSNDDYYSNVDEVQINPSDVDLSDFKLDKNTTVINFSKSIICNINTGKYHNSIMCGTKFEGKDKNLFVERLDSLASRFSSMVDESVEKRKEEIQSRKNDE